MKRPKSYNDILNPDKFLWEARRQTEEQSRQTIRLSVIAVVVVLAVLLDACSVLLSAV